MQLRMQICAAKMPLVGFESAILIHISQTVTPLKREAGENANSFTDLKRNSEISRIAKAQERKD